ncbi:hypothetical protein POTOM_003618 [Populus tomentosa]|uniref:Uncharacterized protein n=1 Tax=Populus tomentosa TaxID=118781 RepID=A0A8X8AIV4_POPTO|nr:hypothetical protein POTOM_003618 [Populus tomentosa]
MESERINLNYYPICPNPEQTAGIGRHSDSPPPRSDDCSSKLTAMRKLIFALLIHVGDTVDLSEEAFASIADPNSGVINISYQQVWEIKRALKKIPT